MQAFILQPKTDRAHLREGERGLLRLPDGPKPSGPALCFKHTSDESFGEVLIDSHHSSRWELDPSLKKRLIFLSVELVSKESGWLLGPNWKHLLTATGLVSSHIQPALEDKANEQKLGVRPEPLVSCSLVNSLFH